MIYEKKEDVEEGVTIMGRRRSRGESGGRWRSMKMRRKMRGTEEEKR